jgi:Antitoxin VbhA
VVVTSDQTSRERAVGNALASVHLEGGEVSAELRALAERYVAGEISIEQLIDVARAGAVTA